MTLIAVICNDLIIFSRSKSRIFENSTLSPCGNFSEFPPQKNKFNFSVPPFLHSSKLHDVKIIFPIFAGTNGLSSAKTRLPRILTETL
mgnify:CR=1 FL=1